MQCIRYGPFASQGIVLQQHCHQDFAVHANSADRRITAAGCAGRGEKKNGRPVVFHGDPNDPRLSTEERRLLKRRIVNRESARRVRLRLRTDLEEQQRLIRSSPPLPTNVLCEHACMRAWTAHSCVAAPDVSQVCRKYEQSEEL